MAVPSRAIALRSEKIFTVPSTVFHFFARARGGTNVRDILVRCSYDTGYHHFPGWLPMCRDEVFSLPVRSRAWWLVGLDRGSRLPWTLVRRLVDPFQRGHMIGLVRTPSIL